MQLLHLDSSESVTADMLVGALCALGVKPSALEWELSKLDIGDFHMHFERREGGELEGVEFSIHAGATHTHGNEKSDHAESDDHDASHDHGHAHKGGGDCCGHSRGAHDEHGHDEHGHCHHHENGSVKNSLAEICEMIANSDLSDFVKTHAAGIFKKMAVSENGSAENLGSLNSIACAVCVCAGLEQLNIVQISASQLRAENSLTAAILAEFESASGESLETIAEKSACGFGAESGNGQPKILRASLVSRAE